MATYKPTKKKKPKKLKLNKETLRIAQQYEKAWHELYYKKEKWLQTEIANNPHGKHSDTLAHDVAKLVEAWEYEREHGSFNDGPAWKDKPPS